MKILLLFLLSVLPRAAMAKNLAEPKPEDATRAMIQLLGHHGIVMFGEIHSSKQEYEWLCKLVKTPGFANQVDDIVVEFGNALYQKSVDRYVTGENVPFDQVQKAWRNTIGSVPPVSPVYGWFYQSVREANLQVLASTGSDSLWEVHQAIGTRSRQRKISLPTRHSANNGICMWLRMRFWPDIIAHCS